MARLVASQSEPSQLVVEQFLLSRANEAGRCVNVATFAVIS